MEKKLNENTVDTHSRSESLIGSADVKDIERFVSDMDIDKIWTSWAADNLSNSADITDDGGLPFEEAHTDAEPDWTPELNTIPNL
jgi:hypothetical protein